MKRILVTGGTGFIGRHLKKPLLDAGFSPIYTYRENYTLEKDDKIEWVKCHLSPKEVGLMMGEVKPEYLLHMAWDVGPGYKNNPNNIEWMNASLNLIDHFVVNNGRKVVIAGTCFDSGYITIEPSTNHTLYGACKRSLWNLVRYSYPSVELAYGRIFYLYGPHESKSRLIPIMINGLLNNERVHLQIQACQVMSLCYVQDVADAFVKAADDVKGEFDVLGNYYSIGTIAQTLTDIMDMDQDMITFGDEWEYTRQPYDELNAMKLGVINKISLIKGLTKTVNWWKQHRENI